MKRNIFFLLFFFPVVLYAQKSYKIQGLIVDSINQTPVDYANIGIEGKNLGTVSNDSGEFELEIPDNFFSDSLIFSRIGYTAKQIAIRDLVQQRNLEIVLYPKSTELKEAKIVSRKLKRRIKGNNTENSFVMPAFYADTAKLGREMGIVIRLPEKSINIKDFNFHVLSVRPDSILFRLNIYEFRNGKVGQNILKQDIYFSISQGDKGNYAIDLSDNNIIVSDDIFVSIENVKGFITSGPNPKIKHDEWSYDRILFSGTLVGAKCFTRDVSLGNVLKNGWWISQKILLNFHHQPKEEASSGGDQLASNMVDA